MTTAQTAPPSGLVHSSHPDEPTHEDILRAVNRARRVYAIEQLYAAIEETDDAVVAQLLVSALMVL